MEMGGQQVLGFPASSLMLKVLLHEAYALDGWSPRKATFSPRSSLDIILESDRELFEDGLDLIPEEEDELHEDVIGRGPEAHSAATALVTPDQPRQHAASPSIQALQQPQAACSVAPPSAVPEGGLGRSFAGQEGRLAAAFVGADAAPTWSCRGSAVSTTESASARCHFAIYPTDDVVAHTPAKMMAPALPAIEECVEDGAEESRGSLATGWAEDFLSRFEDPYPKGVVCRMSPWTPALSTLFEVEEQFWEPRLRGVLGLGRVQELYRTQYPCHCTKIAPVAVLPLTTILECREECDATSLMATFPSDLVMSPKQRCQSWRPLPVVSEDCEAHFVGIHKAPSESSMRKHPFGSSVLPTSFRGAGSLRNLGAASSSFRVRL